MQWICGFLCEKCQKGDPPPKKGGIFIDFWKFTPQRAGTLFRVSRGTPRVWRQKRQKTRFLTPKFMGNVPNFLFFGQNWPNLQKNELFCSFCGVFFISPRQRAVCGIYATYRRFKSIFTTGFFYLLNVLFLGKIQNVTSFPCIYGICGFLLVFQGFNTAH